MTGWSEEAMWEQACNDGLYADAGEIKDRTEAARLTGEAALVEHEGIGVEPEVQITTPITRASRSRGWFDSNLGSLRMNVLGGNYHDF